MIFGIFRRVETPDLQTPAVAIMQVNTGEIWGRISRHGKSPCVKAYAGPLESNVRGIEFTTSTCPHPDQGPLHVNWYHPDTPKVALRQKDGEDFACIDANVTNKQP